MPGSRVDADTPTAKIDALVEALNRSERRLAVVYVESSVYQDAMPPGTAVNSSNAWKETRAGSSGKVWLNGRAGGPFKMIVDREVQNWIDGPKGQAPYLETGKQIQSVGGKTTIRSLKSGVVGNATENNGAVVSNDNRVARSSTQYRWGSGAVFTANRWGEIRDDSSVTLSSYLKELVHNLKRSEDENPAVFEVAEDVVAGQKFVRLTLGIKGSLLERWWFDESKGFAVVRYESLMGSASLVTCAIGVQEFANPSDGVWYPSKAAYEVYGYGQKGDDLVVEVGFRYRYVAGKILANDERLQAELVSPLLLPAGTVVVDSTENRKYTIAPADDQATREIEEALTEAIRATTQPTTRPADIKGRP